jgi:hypothetical protein
MHNRRAKLRVEATIEGHVAFPGIDAEVRCIVTNHSPAGACLAFTPGLEVPRYFDLAIGQEPVPSGVRVVWRRENAVGVAYAAPRAGVPDVIPG